MKKVLIVFLICIIFLSGCNGDFSNKKTSGKATSGVWLSYNEIGEMLSSPHGLKTELENVVSNCNKLGIDNIYIHVRSHGDSLFNSKYFPVNDKSQIYDYDVFEYMITEFHNNNIKVHAWINPYRVRTTDSDINNLNPESPAYKWLTDNDTENDRNVCLLDGIYLNPASDEVQALIINGIREIIDNYSIDGIAFDDYFYPTTNIEFDKLSYEEYKSTAKKALCLDDWRRTNVNSLISGCYNAIKAKDESIVFTVSPSHSIEKNFNELYADSKFWVKNGIVDVIMPQLYFGFLYPQKEYRFDNLLKDWKKLSNENKNVKLIVSLPVYKIGTEAEADFIEWSSNDDIIARQVDVCYNDSSVDGYVFFSYSSLFSEAELNEKQRDNLIQTIKSAEDNNG